MLFLRLVQGLDAKRARSLCPENVQIFYGNLKSLYKKYNYPHYKCGIVMRAEFK